MEDNYQQLSLTDIIYERKTIDKRIRLIELFAGVGAQAKSLEALGVDFEHYRICEWAYNSYCSYNAMHIKDGTDYSNGLSKEQLIEKVRGTSLNYDEPLTDKQLRAKSMDWLRNAYNNIVATHNLVNIMDVHGEDLGIVDTDRYEYLLCYSFPCQDLSLAGNRKGMSTSQADGGTRSGLLWEVKRILSEIKESNGNLPSILLMENVPEVIGQANKVFFDKFERFLGNLGYRSYVKILNAKDFGVPQNRRRCFMLSVLDDYSYSFPTPMGRKRDLRDMLDTDVDKRYFLSEEALNRIARWNAQQKPLEDMERNVEVAPTLTTRSGAYCAGMVLVDTEKMFSEDQCQESGIPIKSASKKGYMMAEDGDAIDISGRMHYHRGTVAKKVAPTLTTNGGYDVGVVVPVDELGGIPIKEDTEEGCKVAKEGDSVYVGERGAGKRRGSVKNGISSTITTKGDMGVVVPVEITIKTDFCNKLLEEGKVKEYSVIARASGGDSSWSKGVEGTKIDDSGVAPTLTTRCDLIGVAVKDNRGFSETEEKLFTEDGNIRRYIGSEKIDEFKEGQMATTTYPNGYGHGPRTHDESIALNTIDKPCVKTPLGIRKLTPKEAMRLMGFQDRDYKAMDSIGMSDMAIYHIAGDSIVVTVLMAIFSRLLGIDYKKKIERYLSGQIEYR